MLEAPCSASDLGGTRAPLRRGAATARADGARPRRGGSQVRLHPPRHVAAEHRPPPGDHRRRRVRHRRRGDDDRCDRPDDPGRDRRLPHHAGLRHHRPDRVARPAVQRLTLPPRPRPQQTRDSPCCRVAVASVVSSVSAATSPSWSAWSSGGAVDARVAAASTSCIGQQQNPGPSAPGFCVGWTPKASSQPTWSTTPPWPASSGMAEPSPRPRRHGSTDAGHQVARRTARVVAPPRSDATTVSTSVTTWGSAAPRRVGRGAGVALELEGADQPVQGLVRLRCHARPARRALGGVRRDGDPEVGAEVVTGLAGRTVLGPGHAQVERGGADLGPPRFDRTAQPGA